VAFEGAHDLGYACESPKGGAVKDSIAVALADSPLVFGSRVIKALLTEADGGHVEE